MVLKMCNKISLFFDFYEFTASFCKIQSTDYALYQKKKILFIYIMSADSYTVLVTARTTVGLANFRLCFFFLFFFQLEELCTLIF
ncbi:hypothetical protein XENTR_v10005770 [Xenopus tropicalis]|nr:hypothetical protein XENTR_v10005770 [Xenopus tropicalis]